MGRVWVRGWVIQYESPHSDRNTSVFVCLCVCLCASYTLILSSHANVKLSRKPILSGDIKVLWCCRKRLILESHLIAQPVFI